MSKPHRAKQTAQRIPTTEKLAHALEQAGAPASMIALARKGHYDDYKSDLTMPIVELVEDCRAAGLTDIADRARNGEFDGQKWESNEWMKTHEARQALKDLGI